MRYIHLLLGQDYGERIHVLNAYAAVRGKEPPAPPTSRGSLSDLGAAKAEGLRVTTSFDAGEIIDVEAKIAYERALPILRDRRSEAEALGDSVRKEEVEEDIAFIERQLKAAIGLDGRVRKEKSLVQNVRRSVGNALTRAVEKIRLQHPPLARHLERSVKKGAYLQYDPEERVHWET